MARLVPKCFLTRNESGGIVPRTFWNASLYGAVLATLRLSLLLIAGLFAAAAVETADVETVAAFFRVVAAVTAVVVAGANEATVIVSTQQ